MEYWARNQAIRVGGEIFMIIRSLVAALFAAVLLPAQPALAATNTGTTPAAESPVAVIDTWIHWTRRTTWLTYGGTSVLEGQVVAEVDALGYTEPLQDAAVALFARPAGSSEWTRVATGVTDSDTVFRFNDHQPSRNTDYRVVYQGDLLYKESSATTRVNVRRVITSTVTRNDDGTLTMRGTVVPKVAGKTVRLQRKTCVSCSWSTLRSTTTTPRSTWAFRVTAPTSRDHTWFYRAVTPQDRDFLTSFSGTWKIRR